LRCRWEGALVGGRESSIITDYWYGVSWDVEALWALDLPAEPFPIARLLWHLDVPLWPRDEQAYRISPRQVLLQPHRYAAEYRRAQQASLMFPIEITFFKRRWMILDGVHRLLKAHEMGLEEVTVRKVPAALFKTLAAR
jgi:hypothetical protein